MDSVCREALDLISDMEEDFHQAYHTSILDSDAGNTGITYSYGQGKTLKQRKVEMDIESRCLGFSKTVIYCTKCLPNFR